MHEAAMHEMSIAQNILEIIEEKVSTVSPNGGKVRVVRLKIGEMAGVVPESLRFCFTVASEGTIAEGAKLSIEETPIRCRCKNCKADFEVERFVFICPACGSQDVEVYSGNELNLVELELDE